MNHKLSCIVLAALFISLAHSASPITTNYSAFTDWIPVIIIASLLACCLAGAYYMLGHLLGNNRIKISAVSEFEQALGSVAIVVIIIGVLYMVGTSDVGFSTIIGSNGASQMYSMCTSYLSHSSIDLLKSNAYITSASGASLPEPTTAVCQNLIGTGGPKSGITSHIDYGLASTYVIMANMTDQSSTELNALYNFDSMTFFLRNLLLFVGVCAPPTCVFPLAPPVGLEMQLNYKPYQGYILQRAIAPSIVVQAMLTLYMDITELAIIMLLIISWPYLLAAGIILRTIPFTRRAGGLIIAATVVGVIIWPTIFLIEYNSLSNMQSQPFIGSSQVLGMALCGFGQVSASNNNNVLFCYTDANTLKTSYIYKNIQPSGYPASISACSAVSKGEFASGANPFSMIPNCYVKRQIDLYAYPNAADIISFYSCYPSGSSILPTELGIISFSIASSATLPISTVLSLFSNGFNLQSNSLISTFFGLDNGSCLSKLGPRNLAATYTSLINMYGLITVVGFIIPIINALILISAMTGISSLMGGETTIIGLSRFI